MLLFENFPDFKQNKTLIAVYGNTLCSYNILAKKEADEDIPLLVPNRLQSSSVNNKEFQYYQIRMKDNYSNFKVFVTVTTGEVDLYVSSKAEEKPISSNKAKRLIGIVTKFQDKVNERCDKTISFI